MKTYASTARESADRLPAETARLDKDAIAIIDLGGQYCHMIGRRLRDLGVQSDIFDAGVASKKLRAYKGIILSGGPQSVYDEDAPKIDPDILKLHKPVLGICYGHQLLAQLLHAKVTTGPAEYGKSTLKLRHPNSIFHDVPDSQTVWMSHGDSVRELPDNIETLATTESCEVAAFADLTRKLYGVQFHPEVAHTTHGLMVLRNFSRKICGISGDEILRGRVAKLLKDIRQNVGDRSVFFFVSGGVDSTVAFTLCAKALPRGRVIGVYVDTGLMRKNETEELQALMDSAGLGDRLKIRPEAERFLEGLRGVTEPEEKRHIIGRLFVRVQEDAMREYGINENEWLLGQGTIYPDTIESGGTNTATALIKTHHNRCDEIRQLIEQGRVIEPLSEFYKDEVRQIGRELGLSELLTERWPFPGPGLAIRCLCGKDQSSRPLLAAHLPRTMRGYTAVHFPIRSVGVQGDFRTYREVIALSGPVDYERLSSISAHLCNASKDYNRVVVFLAGKTTDLKTGRVVGKSLCKERLKLLREADDIVSRIMREDDLVRSVWQFPTILIPVSFAGGESIVLRPINSQDGMTANFAHLPLKTLQAIADEIMTIRGIDAVFLDATDKPPATIEWE
jgi:GMP synthase (glutamine-hydrolysing)